MHIKGYDEQIFRTPWDEEPEPCECGEEDCTCSEDEAIERGDWLMEKRRDREIDDGRQ